MKVHDMRLTTLRRLLLKILSLSLLCAVELLGISESGRAQNSSPLRLSLSQAIDMALKENRDLKLARLAVTDSEHKKEIARSAYFPHIKNESSVLHLTGLAGVQFPAGSFGTHASTGPIPGQNLIIDQGALTTYTSGTGLAQPVTQMFKIHESNRAAIADIKIARIQLEQAEDEVALKVRQLYYGILIAQLKQQAAAEDVSASRVKNQESNDAVERGQALEVAALESHASFLDAQQSALTQRLQIHDLTITLDDLLGLPLTTELQLDEETIASMPIPSREECIRIAREHSPEIRAAQQALVKAKAGLAAAKDAYIPDITGLARYSYQSGVPFLVHNFGTFGFTLTYDLFDGGQRMAEIRDSRTILSEAELNLVKVEDDVSVQVEKAYDKVEQLQDLGGVTEEALKARTEAAPLTHRQFEKNPPLASPRAEAHAKAISAKASTLEAALGLSLAQSDLMRTIGRLPR